jgi:hypothetical protein
VAIASCLLFFVLFGLGTNKFCNNCETTPAAACVLIAISIFSRSSLDKDGSTGAAESDVFDFLPFVFSFVFASASGFAVFSAPDIAESNF